MFSRQNRSEEPSMKQSAVSEIIEIDRDLSGILPKTTGDVFSFLKCGNEVITRVQIRRDLLKSKVYEGTHRGSDPATYACQYAHGRKEQVTDSLHYSTSSFACRFSNRYFTSEWRRNPEQCPGGFLGNCGVHLVAALRLVAQGLHTWVLSAVADVAVDLGCGEIETVSGQASNLASQKLPPVNTINAWICFSNGISGTFTVTFAAGQVSYLNCYGVHLGYRL